MGVALAPGDVTDAQRVRAAMAGATAVIHNAGHYELGLDAAGRRRMQAVNETGTEVVLGAAHELGLSRVVHVSTVGAFGDSGPIERDETFRRQSPIRTWYERTKTNAHAIAQRYRARGLPVISACPSVVIGADDHSAWGYFLRLYLNRMMPPMAWAPCTRIAMVDVDDVAEGLALAAERGRPGEAYLLTGEILTLADHLRHWALRPGGYRQRVWLPSSVMAASMWPLAPVLRAMGLPAFMSPEVVRAAATHFAYRNDKARRELGWSPRPAYAMWLKALDGELALLKQRRRRDLASRLRPVGRQPASAGRHDVRFETAPSR